MNYYNYEEFDKLPKSQREREYYYPSINYYSSIPPEEIIRHMAHEDFGPEHPQAQGELCWPLKP